MAKLLTPLSLLSWLLAAQEAASWCTALPAAWSLPLLPRLCTMALTGFTIKPSAFQAQTHHRAESQNVLRLPFLWTMLCRQVGLSEIVEHSANLEMQNLKEVSFYSFIYALPAVQDWCSFSSRAAEQELGQRTPGCIRGT